MTAFFLFLVALMTGVVVYLVAGIRRVPIGAAGVVIQLGRRTNDVRSEGVTWLPKWIYELVEIYLRERQIDIPKAQYYTADRVRLEFKTTVRVKVSDPCALYDQGPGTYLPFTRDAYGEEHAGSEEENVGLRRLVENSIRESVQSLSYEQVLFDGRVEGNLRQRIVAGLEATARRWGLQVVEVWLTDVEARDDQLRSALQSEAEQSLVGLGEKAKFRARLGKANLFQEIADEMVQLAEAQGRPVSLEAARDFLVRFYQNERSLEVALAAAHGKNELMQLFYLQQSGLPVPGSMMPGRSPEMKSIGPSRASAETTSSLGGTDGSWTLGREGAIVIDGDGVSRSHARIDIRGGRLMITDLDSTNGTWVDGRRLTAHTAVELGSDSRVHFGQHAVYTAEQLRALVGRVTPT